jgi:hypothetical protein
MAMVIRVGLRASLIQACSPRQSHGNGGWHCFRPTEFLGGMPAAFSQAWLRRAAHAAILRRFRLGLQQSTPPLRHARFIPPTPRVGRPPAGHAFDDIPVGRDRRPGPQPRCSCGTAKTWSRQAGTMPPKFSHSSARPPATRRTPRGARKKERVERRSQESDTITLKPVGFSGGLLAFSTFYFLLSPALLKKPPGGGFFQ